MLCQKLAVWVANNVDPDETPLPRCLILMYTVCSNLSVRIQTVNTVCYVKVNLSYAQTRYSLRLNSFFFLLALPSLVLLHSSWWLGGAKVSCIFCHRGVQLILAYSWARPVILVAGKGREVMFLFLLFLHFHSCSSFFPVPLFHLFCYLFCLFSPFLWEMTQNDPQGLTCR